MFSNPRLKNINKYFRLNRSYFYVLSNDAEYYFNWDITKKLIERLYIFYVYLKAEIGTRVEGEYFSRMFMSLEKAKKMIDQATTLMEQICQSIVLSECTENLHYYEELFL